MNFDFTDDQQAIKATAREFLASRFKPERVRELAEAGEYDAGVWSQMCELGWPGIFIGEEHGGQGLGIVELVILMEEMGYALAPSPYFSNAAAGLVIDRAGSDEQRARWLPGIASGEQPGSVALVQGDDGPALVTDPPAAGPLVIVEDGSAEISTSAEVEQIAGLDSTRRLGRLGDRGETDELSGDPAPALDMVRVALAAELVGVAQRVLEMTVDYARERKQFNTPIGAFQAVSHRCAQMMLEVEGARSITYYAAWTADAEPESLARAAAMAKAFASDAGWRVTASALQVHGGIGFTWEHDLHFFLKRAKTDGHLFGSARELRERVAETAALTEEVPA